MSDEYVIKIANEGKYRPIEVPSQPKKVVRRAKTRRTIIMTAIVTVGIAAFVNKGIPFIANSVELIIDRVQEKIEESNDYKELMEQKAEIEERLGFNKTDKGMSK